MRLPDIAANPDRIVPLQAGCGTFSRYPGQVAVRSTGQNPRALSMPRPILMPGR